MTQSKLPLIGQSAPNFTLPSSTGDSIELASFAGNSLVVLYFYPKADTPGCTKQACGFRDAIAQFKKANIAILGISPDPIKDVAHFSNKFSLNFPLLADEDHSVTERYGVWQEKSMFANKYWGAARTTFIIAKDGTLAHVFEKVKPEGHDEFILAWLKENGLISGR